MCICKTKTFDIIKWNVIVKKVTCILKQTKLPNAASISLLFFIPPFVCFLHVCVCVRARIFTCKCRIQMQMASVWNEQHCQKQTTLIELFTRFLFYATSRPPIAPKLCNCYGYVCDDYLLLFIIIWLAAQLSAFSTGHYQLTGCQFYQYSFFGEFGGRNASCSFIPFIKVF